MLFAAKKPLLSISSFILFFCLLILPQFLPTYDQAFGKDLTIGRETFDEKVLNELSWEEFEKSLYDIAVKLSQKKTLQRESGWYFSWLARPETQWDILSEYQTPFQKKPIPLNFRQYFHTLMSHFFEKSRKTSQPFPNWEEEADTQLSSLCFTIKKDIHWKLHELESLGAVQVAKAFVNLSSGLDAMAYSPQCLRDLSELIGLADGMGYSFDEIFSPAMQNLIKASPLSTPHGIERLKKISASKESPHKTDFMIGAQILLDILYKKNNSNLKPQLHPDIGLKVRSTSTHQNKNDPFFKVRIDDIDDKTIWLVQMLKYQGADQPTVQVTATEFVQESEEFLKQITLPPHELLSSFLLLYGDTFNSQLVLEELAKAIITDLKKHRGITYSLLRILDSDNFFDLWSNLPYLDIKHVSIPLLQSRENSFAHFNGRRDSHLEIYSQNLSSFNPATQDIILNNTSGTLALGDLKGADNRLLKKIVGWQGFAIKLMDPGPLGPELTSILPYTECDEIQFPEFESLSHKDAKTLSSWKGEKLYFPKLKSLTFEAAEALGAWKSSKPQKKQKNNVEQSLGLASPSIGVHVLSQFKNVDRFYFVENFTSSLDLKMATFLAKRNSLLFYRFESLSPELAELIIDLKPWFLDLSGLKTINSATFHILSQWRGEKLILSGLNDIAHDVFEQIIQAQGKILFLDGLQDITADTIEFLTKWQGDQIVLKSQINIPRNRLIELMQESGPDFWFLIDNGEGELTRSDLIWALQIERELNALEKRKVRSFKFGYPAPFPSASPDKKEGFRDPFPLKTLSRKELQKWAALFEIPF